MARTVGPRRTGVLGARIGGLGRLLCSRTFAPQDDRTEHNATTLTAVKSVSRMARPQRGKRPVQGGTGPRTFSRFTPEHFTPRISAPAILSAHPVESRALR